jgi:phosphoglycolate phosphatase
LKLIIFDFDGTLINSVPDLTTSVNYMYSFYGLDEINEEILANWLGDGAEKLVERALIFHNLDYNGKALKIFKSHYSKNYANKTILYPHAKEILEYLKDKYKLALITNKPYEFVNPILNKLKINCFDLILGGDSLKEKKPSPYPILHTCEKLNIPISKTAIVGDSKNDILAGKNAGIKTIAVTHGYNFGEDIKKYNPDIIINTLKELKEIF